MELKDIFQTLEGLANLEDVSGMARFGINPKKTFGVRIPQLRKIAQELGKDHELAHKLWDAGYRETRIIATMIEVPKMVSDEQMDKWAMDFDTWEICDQCCNNLFRKTKQAYNKAREWGDREEELVKRAAFVLIATLAVHDKTSPDEVFIEFFPLIINESTDERNFVKKSVNWALRQIGKRNKILNKKAIDIALEIENIDSKSAKWIARDALQELRSKKIQDKLTSN